MLPVRLTTLLVFVAAFCFAPTTEAQSLRVAVVAEGSPDLEALLVTKLGKRKDLEMLSRTELPALAKEAVNFTRSGTLHLSGAERLVMIQKTGDSYAVRVADCATGAVIHEGTLPPKLGAAALSDLLALRLPRFLQISPKAGAQRIALHCTDSALRPAPRRTVPWNPASTCPARWRYRVPERRWCSSGGG